MILENFSQVYFTQIDPTINFLIRTFECDWEPIRFTLDKGRNRFRSALAVISGNINQLDPNLSSVIGAISELLHTAIIIQDDIADRDDFRRGDVAAWKKFGIDRAIFCCEQVVAVGISYAFFILKEEAALHLLQTIFEVNRGQSLQARSTFNDDVSPDLLQKIHHDKTALGRWALTCPCVINANSQLLRNFDQYSRLLGEAGCIKNDLENIVMDNNYDSTNMDLSIERVNIPLLRLAEITQLKGNEDRHELQKMLYDTGVYISCKDDIERYISEAIYVLGDLPDSAEKKLLIDWARYHTVV
jgi:geranylgeranyl diphosphate synthase, type I